jgi:hypothetical protein
MWHLAEVLDASSGSGDQSSSMPSLYAAAGRIVGSWAATADDRLEDDRRRRFAEAAARHAPGEAESWFRLAAVRFATLDDIGGFEALTRARDLMHATDSPSFNADQQIFVVAELSADDGQCTTLGRVAAGIGLLLSTLAHDKLRFVADDLRDELRFSGLLVGRDQDHRLLLEVVNLFSPPVFPAMVVGGESSESIHATPVSSDASAHTQVTTTAAAESRKVQSKPAETKRSRAASKPRAAAPAKPRRKAA